MCQMVIRRLGLSCGQISKRGTSEENIDIVGLHVDRGDLSTRQPLIYIPRGGKNKRGGFVADSELVVAESETGGRFVCIETNVEDTVCIVLFNSAKHLHGLVERNEKREQQNGWCTRLIPFITNRVHEYMKRNKGDSPIDKYKVRK